MADITDRAYAELLRDPDMAKVKECRRIASLLNYASAGLHAFYGMTEYDEDGSVKTRDPWYGLNKLRNIAMRIKEYGVDKFIEDIEKKEAVIAVCEMEEEIGWMA